MNLMRSSSDSSEDYFMRNELKGAPPLCLDEEEGGEGSHGSGCDQWIMNTTLD